MQRLTPTERVLAAALAALAGFVDATGFLELGGYFVSFMSGNTTRAAVGLSTLSPTALAAAGLIAAFVIGVVIGSLIGHAAGARRRPWVLAAVALLLGLAAAAGATGAVWIAASAMALAMGAENAVFEEQGDVRFGLTYMTGALVKIGQRIAAALRGGDRLAWAPYLLQWLALGGGAVLGAWLHPRLGLSSLWLAALVAALLAAASARLRALSTR